MPKILQTTDSTTKLVDPNTGEIRTVDEHHSVTLRHEPTPPFIMLFLKDLMYFTDMPAQFASLTYALLPYVTQAKDGMLVCLNSYIKRKVCDELGWKNISSFNNALNQLVKGEILFRVGRGTYQLNPYLFGKGNWADVEALRQEIVWSPNGRTFSQVITDEKGNQQRLTTTKQIPGQMKLSHNGEVIEDETSPDSD